MSKTKPRNANRNGRARRKPVYRTPRITLYRGDCLGVLADLLAGSVDTVITDPPHGLMDIEWDAKAPDWPNLWQILLRVAAPHAAIVIFAIEPAATKIIVTSLCHFRYDLIWSKNIATGYLNANRMPLRAHERILVFGNGRLRYNRQDFPRTRFTALKTIIRNATNRSQLYGGEKESRYTYGPTRCATSVLEFPRPANYKARQSWHHPTAKPLALVEWLVKSYAPPGGTVLDPFLGSGTTAVACLNTGRKCIGIEKDPAYCRITIRRLKEAAKRQAP